MNVGQLTLLLKVLHRILTDQYKERKPIRMWHPFEIPWESVVLKLSQKYFNNNAIFCMFILDCMYIYSMCSIIIMY